MARILHIVPHAVYPPESGAVRPFFIMRELCKRHEVHLVVFQSPASLREAHSVYPFPSGVQVYHASAETTPRTLFDWLPSRLANALRDRWLRRSLRGPANAVLLQSHHLLKRILRSRQIDLVIIDHQFCLAHLAPVLRRLSPSSRRILHAHNVDSDLMRQEFSANGGARPRRRREAHRRTTWTESNLASFVDSFWACSDVDRAKLETLNAGRISGVTIPSGIDSSILPFDANPEKTRLKTVFFCGSLSYGPNKTGLLWFHREVWPRVVQAEPAARLRVVGRGFRREDFPELAADSRVDLVGEVNSVLAEYARSSLAIAPLLQGSGVRTKILESMSLGCPVVSTTKGAEGIAYESGRDILIADTPQGFAETTVQLLRDPALHDRVRRAARRLVENHYEWRTLGLQMDAAVTNLLEGAFAESGVRQTERPE
jgi:glycosyltransferase involved in cell wall biosynthesis